MSEAGLRIELPPAVLEQLVELVATRVLEVLGEREGGDGSPEFLDVPAAAAFLGITVGRMRKLQARRALPYHQEGPGCRVLFARSDLEEFMAGQRTSARSDGRSTWSR